MERVLQVFGEPLDNGGQEAFIMNMYRNINRTQVQFDFFTPYYCCNEKLRAEIEEMGGKVFEIKGRFDSQGNKKDFVRNLSAFLSEHKYDTVHIHSGSIFSLAFGSAIAKKNGARKVLVHSHATGNNNLTYKVIKAASPLIFANNVTHYLACSKIAAEWKFPKRVIRQNAYKIIKNGIDLQRFSFNKEIRKAYREQLGVADCKVICHVGRLSEEKNHKFLIEVFSAIKDINDKAILLLVGDGPLRERLEQTVNDMGLKESVIFLGNRPDVCEILQASDAFIFPSLFEGLGIAAIEAQATGLPTFCSENIPEEADVTELFYRINTELGPQIWAEKILSIDAPSNREDYARILAENGYDSKDSAYSLEMIYKQK